MKILKLFLLLFTIFTTFAYSFYSKLVFTIFVQTCVSDIVHGSCSQVLFATFFTILLKFVTQLVHKFYSKLLFSTFAQFFLKVFAQTFFSQCKMFRTFVYKNFCPIFALNFCSQLLFLNFTHKFYS